MLLAVEHGLDTCAQECWARYGATVRVFLKLADEEMIYSGMSLGYRDGAAPINTLRSLSDPSETWCEMRGFD